MRVNWTDDRLDERFDHVDERFDRVENTSIRRARVGDDATKSFEVELRIEMNGRFDRLDARFDAHAADPFPGGGRHSRCPDRDTQL